MKSAHELSNPIDSAHPQGSGETHIPFGVIFATFMAAMMLGSLFFSRLSSPPPSGKPLSTPNILSRLQRGISPSTLLTACILVATISLLLPILLKSESLTFWSYCVFEACIGVYFPSMGAQKGRIVADGVRANIYGILRIPLNVFVVVALTTTVEGSEHRDKVFLICGGLLFMAGLGVGWLAEPGEGENVKIESEDVEAWQE
jgi:hypothetical protein